MFDIAKNFFSHLELLKNLVIKELKVRYKNSVFGFLWALLNPLLMMIVFTIVFTQIQKIKTDEYYPLFLLCGYLPWIFFQNSLSESTTSIVSNSSLINKVYFPRELFPISKILSSLVNFLLGLTVLIPFLIYFGTKLSYTILFLPLLILFQVLFTIGIALIFASINVYFRDVGNLIEILMLTWLFLTPIWYPIKLVLNGAGKYILFYLLNPMACFVVLYREILLSRNPDFVVNYAISVILLSTTIIFFAGYYIFYKLEPGFAKEI
jgi:lipopolysaccharide transport system permease protein